MSFVPGDLVNVKQSWASPLANGPGELLRFQGNYATVKLTKGSAHKISAYSAGDCVLIPIDKLVPA